MWRTSEFIEVHVVPLQAYRRLLLSLCRRALNWLLPALRSAVGMPDSRGGGRQRDAWRALSVTAF